MGVHTGKRLDGERGFESWKWNIDRKDNDVIPELFWGEGVVVPHPITSSTVDIRVHSFIHSINKSCHVTLLLKILYSPPIAFRIKP